MNKNLSLLVLSQVFGFTNAAITVFLGGIIGSQITSIKSLATLPVALSVVGTAIYQKKDKRLQANTTVKRIN